MFFIFLWKTEVKTIDVGIERPCGESKHVLRVKQDIHKSVQMFKDVKCLLEIVLTTVPIAKIQH